MTAGGVGVLNILSGPNTGTYSGTWTASGPTNLGAKVALPDGDVVSFECGPGGISAFDMFGTVHLVGSLCTTDLVITITGLGASGNSTFTT